LFIIFYLTQHPLPMLREDLKRSMFCRELHVRVSSLLPREKIRLRFTLPKCYPSRTYFIPKRQTVQSPPTASDAIPASWYPCISLCSVKVELLVTTSSFYDLQDNRLFLLFVRVESHWRHLQWRIYT
jgi:hypothetical protein